jgi:hypothetical protein
MNVLPKAMLEGIVKLTVDAESAMLAVSTWNHSLGSKLKF